MWLGWIAMNLANAKPTAKHEQAAAPTVPIVPASVLPEVAAVEPVVSVMPPAPAVPPAEVAPPAPSRPTVEIVIALDVSGSMNALLDSARMKLWDVVNQVGRAEPQPLLKVGLYTYGRNDGTARFLLRNSALTDNLDDLSERLMAIHPSGSDEYVGAVIADATTGAGWSTDPSAVRLLFVCGNETAAQGPVGFGASASDAQRAGLVVNAIYGGGYENGKLDHWAELASAGGGIYAAIDMVRGTVRLPPAPQDGILETLNAELSETYVSIHGLEESKEQQLSADRASTSLGTTSSRATTKSSGMYRVSWDLVDGWESGALSLTRTELLPEHLRAKTLAEREAYVAGLRDWRRQVQAKIRVVTAERSAWLEAERAKQMQAPDGLDDAMKRLVREQLEARGLTFPNG